MAKRFFKPYYNYNNYKLGLLNNIKVLVLGASFYCTYNKKSDKYQCPEWEKCTSKKIKIVLLLIKLVHITMTKKYEFILKTLLLQR